MRRKRYGDRLEDLGVFKRRKYCDKQCMAAHHATQEPTSKAGHQWRSRRHRKSACERCGSTEKLHVHHKDNNWRNGDISNLETLCASCHIKHHWATDGRRERMASTRRVPLEALQALEGFADEYGAALDARTAAALHVVVELFRK